MTTEASKGHYGVYARTWIVLLVLTLIMILVDQLAVPRVLLVGFLLGAMLVKAGLIGANFMHLKFERKIVGVSVATALLFLGGILYLLMVPDGHRILRMVYTW